MVDVNTSKEVDKCRLREQTGLLTWLLAPSVSGAADLANRRSGVRRVRQLVAPEILSRTDN